MLGINVGLYKPGIIIGSILLNLFPIVLAFFLAPGRHRSAKDMVMTGVLTDVGIAFIIAALVYMRANTPKLVPSTSIPTGDATWGMGLSIVMTVTCTIGCWSKKSIPVGIFLGAFGLLSANVVACYLYIFLSVIVGTWGIDTAVAVTIYIAIGVMAYILAFSWAGIGSSDIKDIKDKFHKRKEAANTDTAVDNDEGYTTAFSMAEVGSTDIKRMKLHPENSKDNNDVIKDENAAGKKQSETDDPDSDMR